ncbi:DUF418 domain-containing protein [Actinopolymorpha alba]|uniref:DUF418 domain-containing protein n=1 Tax=Actinopolymorpha alba TaxID=533267 RepID=UPI0012F6C6D0|nr:DUF418 domain-containing protein [Actinopolymorpha alba]
MKAAKERASASQDATAHPGRIGPRIMDVDALRGFALLGILIVNITFFASGYPVFGAKDPAFSSGVDHALHWVQALLFDTKFYLLFSFLFGYSFTLQLDSAARQGAAFTPRILRRIAGLLVLGAAHSVLLFHGDILRLYAVLGLILLAVHRIRPRTALIVAGVLIGLTALSLVLSGLAMLADPAMATDPAGAAAEGARSTAALQGGPASVIAEYVRLLPQNLLAWASMQAPTALAAFLVGLAAGKRRLLSDVAQHIGVLRAVQWAGYPIGLVGAVVFTSFGTSYGSGAGAVFALALSVITAPLLTAAYVATLLRLFQSERGQRIAAALAPAGRMALSNYLFQSLICTLLFTGYGLGLIGQLSPLVVLLVAVAIFCAQLVVSTRWLASHGYGPVEWLLRALTNAARPAWRRVPQLSQPR